MTLLHAAISSKANSKRNTGRRSSTSSLRTSNSSNISASSFTKLQQYENHLLTTSTPPSIATTKTKKKSNYEQLIAAKELYKNEVAKLQSLSHNCNNNDVGTWPSNNTSFNTTDTSLSTSISSSNNKPFDEEEDAVVSTAYTIYKSETILQNNINQEIENIDILDEVNASLLLADELNAVLDEFNLKFDLHCSKAMEA